MCNKEIKFKLMYSWAMDNGFDYVATGHYAQVQESGIRNKKLGKDPSTPSSLRSDFAQGVSGARSSALLPELVEGKYQLVRSVDEFKDQTYFIYNIKTEQLPHVLFPIGHLKKPEVRKLAQKLKLPNADKKESMGLCFVGRIRLKDFLEQKLKPKKGPIIDQKGKKVGEHDGLYTYTIGQRQGIKVGGGEPYYVVGKDLKKKTLLVTQDPKDPALMVKNIQIHSVNWITKPNPPAGGVTKLKARYRHQGELVAVTVSPTAIKSKKTGEGSELYDVVFAKEQKAIASGQSLVLYDGKVCVGGGVIV
jgi:tRNA-specific 2-thiouridylase